MLFHIFESSSDEVNLALRRTDSLGRFLLKCVEHVHHISESYCIDSSIRVTIVVLNDFEHACTNKPLQRLCIYVFSTILGLTQRETHDVLDIVGKLSDVIER